MSKDRQKTYKYRGRNLTVGFLSGKMPFQMEIAYFALLTFLRIQDLRHQRSEVTVELRRVSVPGHVIFTCCVHTVIKQTCQAIVAFKCALFRISSVVV